MTLDAVKVKERKAAGLNDIPPEIWKHEKVCFEHVQTYILYNTSEFTDG